MLTRLVGARVYDPANEVAGEVPAPNLAEKAQRNAEDGDRHDRDVEGLELLFLHKRDI